LAHPKDWTTASVTGKIDIPTWDGDTAKVFRNLMGDAVLIKNNSFFEITGSSPTTYAVNQIYTAKGTVATNSVVWHGGNLFYATTEGIMRYNSSASEPYLTAEIQQMWYAANTGAICNVVGDTLFVYGQLYHPITEALGYGMLAVDLLTKNVCYFDMLMGATTLGFACTFDPWFTTFKSSTIKPELWFAYQDQIYRYKTTKDTSSLPDMDYYEPATDLGTSIHLKRLSKIAVTGKGGTLSVTPYKDGTAQTAKTIELPAAVGVPRPTTLSVSARRAQLVYANVGGDPVEIHDIEREYSAQGG
jgi:hypothetical protein